MMSEIIFQILSSLLVAGIIICKEYNVTIKGISKTIRNILFLIEPFVYMACIFSWLQLSDCTIGLNLTLSFFLGLIFFIAVTASFLPSKSGAMPYSVNELKGMNVVISSSIDERNYLGDLLRPDGKRDGIVVTSDENLNPNDIVSITEINNNSIIVTKIEKHNGD